MKQNKNLENTAQVGRPKYKPPIRYTIMIFFLLFSFILILLLWVFQTVFLDNFYRSVKISQVKSTAASVASFLENFSSEEDADDLSKIISKQSEMSILIYDTEGSVYTEIYGDRGYLGVSDIKAHEVYRYYKEAKENGGTAIDFTNEIELTGGLRIPDHDGKSSDNGNIRYPYGLGNRRINFEQRELESVIYAQIVEAEGERSEYFIVIDARITPVTGTVSTLRIQLVIITWILVALSTMLAFIISRVVAGPIIKMNKNAKELAKQNYNIEFSGGAYREIQELNSTLNFATNELSKAENLRRELIANVSHDLRTPLTMIIGYGEVIRDLPGENTPENIQIIIDEATHLSTLVSDLMDLSKLESGALQLEPETFSLTESVKNIFMRYSRLVSQDGYKIVFESDSNVSVNADEIKITQVLYNLINNAVNYAGEDKTVTVRQIINEKDVTVEVEDHGKGIEADKLEFIWDRYYKVDKSHKSSVIGTGLGLSIVKNILDLHNAAYGVKSKINSGSIFWFTLPHTGVERYEAGKTVIALSADGEVVENVDIKDNADQSSALPEASEAEF